MKLDLTKCDLLVVVPYRHLLQVGVLVVLGRLALLLDRPVLEVHHGLALLQHLPETKLLLLLRQDGRLGHSGFLAKPEATFLALASVGHRDDAAVAASASEVRSLGLLVCAAPESPAAEANLETGFGFYIGRATQGLSQLKILKTRPF